MQLLTCWSFVAIDVIHHVIWLQILTMYSQSCNVQIILSKYDIVAVDSVCSFHGILLYNKWVKAWAPIMALLSFLIVKNMYKLPKLNLGLSTPAGQSDCLRFFLSLTIPFSQFSWWHLQITTDRIVIICMLYATDDCYATTQLSLYIEMYAF